MSEQHSKLNRLTQLIDEFDTFGNLERDMSLFAVAIGTLRKDRSLAGDIVKTTDRGSDGLGAVALTRILIEDYMHLKFLSHNQENLAQRIEDFNAHPHITHYTSLHAMKEVGFRFESQEAKDLVEKVTAGFEKYKNRFLRHKTPKESFDPDDYYRTWTKMSLGRLLKESGLVDTDADKISLRFLTDTYDAASSIIHHNSFIIWFLASQNKDLLAKEYPDLALSISTATLSRTIHTVLEISQTVIGDAMYLQYLNRLEGAISLESD